MKLIGLSGQMGVGKSTAVDLIREASEHPVHVVKFAQPLYDMQEMIYTRIESVYKRPANFIKDRKLLQWIGTEWGRDSISQSLWIDLWKAEVQTIYQTNPSAIIICDDCRFDNEADAIKKLSGVIIQLTSTRASERINTQAGIKAHASEAGINKRYLDASIPNNGSLGEFKTNLCMVLRVHGLLE